MIYEISNQLFKNDSRDLRHDPSPPSRSTFCMYKPLYINIYSPR